MAQLVDWRWQGRVALRWAAACVPRPWRQAVSYTDLLMPCTFTPFAAHACAFQGGGVVPRALFTRAKCARMITTMTTAAP